MLAGLRGADRAAVHRARARRIEGISPAAVLAAPTMSIFYCVNIFTKLAVGALSGFEYVAILAGETRSPARDIGRSVLIASPVIALMFILGTSSVLAFIGDNPIDLIGPVPQTLRLGLAILSDRGRNRIHRHYVDDHANDCVDERSRHRQLAIADGRRLGPICCRVGFRVCIRVTKRRSTRSFSSARVTLVTIAISSQIGAGIQEAFQLGR